MASQYLNETKGRRAHLGISPLMLAGVGVIGAYGLSGVDSFMKPSYVGAVGRKAGSTTMQFKPAVAARYARAKVSSFGRKLASVYPGNWKSTASVGFYPPAKYDLAQTIGKGIVSAGRGVGRGVKSLYRSATSAIGRAWPGNWTGGTANVTFTNAPSIDIWRKGSFWKTAARGASKGWASLKSFGSGAMNRMFPRGAGGVTFVDAPSIDMWREGNFWKNIRSKTSAAWHGTYTIPRPQTIGSFAKRAGVNAAKMPLLGIGALGGKGTALAGMGIAAGLGIWAGATMALMSFMPYAAQGPAHRGSIRVMGPAVPTFTASRGPMSPNNLATNGLSQSLYNTRHGQR